MRELGRFGEAPALLGELEGNGEAVLVQADPHETFAEYSAAQMRLAIAERDDGRFPVELLDQRMVGPICDGGLVAPYDERTAGTVAACEARRAREAREDEEEEAALAEADVLREDLPALERQCRETAPEARKRGLEAACLRIEWQRDKQAADALLLDHAQQVAEDCERVTGKRANRRCSLACTSYEGAVEDAAADLLAGDDAATRSFASKVARTTIPAT